MEVNLFATTIAPVHQEQLCQQTKHYITFLEPNGNLFSFRVFRPGRGGDSSGSGGCGSVSGCGSHCHHQLSLLEEEKKIR